VPNYFVFNMRIDGHKAPAKPGASVGPASPVSVSTSSQ
jgi:hypothetical protein